MMEDNGRVPRDSKWLLPAMNLGAGRHLRSKRNIAMSVAMSTAKKPKHKKLETKPSCDQIKQSKYGKSSRVTSYSKKSENTKQAPKTRKNVTLDKTPHMQDLETKAKVNQRRNKKDGVNVKKTGAVKRELGSMKESSGETELSDTDGKLDANPVMAKKDNISRSERMQFFHGKYTCYHCREYFTKESSLAEHIKWIHGDIKKRKQIKAEDKPVTGKSHEEKESHNGSSDLPLVFSESEKTKSKTEDQDMTIGEDVAENADGEDVKKENALESTDESTTKETTSNDLIASDGGSDVESESTPDLYTIFEPGKVNVVCSVNSRDAIYCQYCSKVFASSKGMKAHVELHCKQVPFRCTDCNKGLTSINQEHKHFPPSSKIKNRKQYYVKQSDRQKSYKCKHCLRGFLYKVTLENHMLMCNGKQPGKGRAKCKHCGKIYSKSYMSSHLKYHENKKAHACDVCGARFNTSSRMMNHKEIIHRKTNRFQCQHCGTVFVQKAALQNHQNVMFGKCKADRTNIRAFQCKLCTRTFSSLRWMTRHQNLHLIKQESCDATVMKAFDCAVCGKSFKNRHEHTRHVRIHTNERPHKCSVCGVGFVQKCNLQAHMRIHTGERPYVCHLCSKGFTQPSNLKSHMTNHYKGRIPDNSTQKSGKKISDGEIYRTDLGPKLKADARNSAVKVDTACQTARPVKQMVIDSHATLSSHGSIVVKRTDKVKKIPLKNYFDWDKVIDESPKSTSPVGAVQNNEIKAHTTKVVDAEQDVLGSNLRNKGEKVDDFVTVGTSFAETINATSEANKETIVDDLIALSEEEMVPDNSVIYVSEANFKTENTGTDAQEMVVYVFDKADRERSRYDDKKESVIYIRDTAVTIDADTAVREDSNTIVTVDSKDTPDAANKFDKLYSSIADIPTTFAISCGNNGNTGIDHAVVTVAGNNTVVSEVPVNCVVAPETMQRSSTGEPSVDTATALSVLDHITGVANAFIDASIDASIDDKCDNEKP